MLTLQRQQLELRMRHTMQQLHQHTRPGDIAKLMQLASDAKHQASDSRQENARLRARLARVQRNAQRILAMLAGSLATPMVSADSRVGIVVVLYPN